MLATDVGPERRPLSVVFFVPWIFTQVQLGEGLDLRIFGLQLTGHGITIFAVAAGVPSIPVTDWT